MTNKLIENLIIELKIENFETRLLKNVKKIYHKKKTFYYTPQKFAIAGDLNAKH